MFRYQKEASQSWNFSKTASHLCDNLSVHDRVSPETSVSPLSPLAERFSQLFASLQHEQNLSLLAGSQLNFILPNLKDLYGSNFSLNCEGIFEKESPAW